MPKKKEIPKKGETCQSLFILLILAGIGTCVFLAQFRHHPAVLPVSLTLADGDESSSGSASRSPKSMVRVPENISPLTPAEAFDAGNLSDKINGKAELYLSSGFLGLRCQRFELEDPASWMEFFVYDMGNSSNAFSVFSSQRRENAEPLELTQFSYRTKNALFMTHGAYYVEIVASAASEKLFEAMKSVAENFVRDTRAEKTSVNEADLFPKPGLIPGSITLLSANVFGYDKLDKVFTATYKFEDTQVMAFLSRRKTAAEAAQLARGFHAFLQGFGGQAVEPRVQMKTARITEIMGTYELTFVKGTFMAGVHEAESEDIAVKLADMLNQQMKDE